MQPSRIHHVGLPVTDLDFSIAWYREALGLTHEATAGVPGGVAFMVAPTGERLELLAVDVQPSAWDEPIAALRAGVPHTAWTVDDLDAAHARAVEAGGRSVWTCGVRNSIRHAAWVYSWMSPPSRSRRWSWSGGFEPMRCSRCSGVGGVRPRARCGLCAL